MCDPVQSRSQSANLQKLQSCQIPGVKWINGNRNHVKFSAFENWLSARLRYLQCLCYWDADLKLGHKSIYGLLNLAKLGSGNGLLPEGNWTPSHLCTFADYYWVIINDTLWHLTWFHWKYKIQSLKWPSFCRRHYQMHFFFNQIVCIFINISPNCIPMGPMC